MGLLDDKIAIVTGAASGIGRAGARLMAEAGATVVVADINDEGGEAVAAAIAEAGGEAVFSHFDVCEVGSVQDLVAGTVERYGRIDALFHNAVSVPLVNKHDNRATELDDAIWDRIIGMVLTGTYYCAKHVGRQMLEQRSGSMVLTATTDALIGQAGIDAYTAAKGGVVSLTRSLAAGISPEGVRVNAICPGFVKTPHPGELPRCAGGTGQARGAASHAHPRSRGHRPLRGVPRLRQGALHDRRHPRRRFGLHRVQGHHGA